MLEVKAIQLEFPQKNNLQVFLTYTEERKDTVA